MRKRLALAGLIMLVLASVGWVLYLALAGSVASGEAALGWLILFFPVTIGALILGVVGLIILILGLVLKEK